MLFHVSDTETADAASNNGGQLLLQLQGLDTAADQAQHRKANLAERETLKSVAESVIAWEKRCTELTALISGVEDAIACAEQQSGEIDAKRSRLHEQLKTVIDRVKLKPCNTRLRSSMTSDQLLTKKRSSRWMSSRRLRMSCPRCRRRRSTCGNKHLLR